jgi:poly-gamma-glutamate capsule biosynthesis protein CapA/YwtB (metallophosphatase superfamily)
MPLFSVPFETPCESPVKVGFYGDIYVTSKYHSVDTKIFSNMRPLLDWADFNVANLEGAITTSNRKAFPTFPFALKIDPKIPAVLTQIGIRHLTRANNHAMDYGVEGLRETDAALRAEGLTWAGTGENIAAAMEPFVLEKNAIRIAVFSFSLTYPSGAWANVKNPGTAYYTLERAKPLLEEYKTKVDFAIPIFHWGAEGSRTPRDYQPLIAKQMVRAGADFVLGHHAHIAQNIEVVEGKPVAYGLGNFFFSSRTDRDEPSMGALVQFCKNPKIKGSTAEIIYVPLDTYNVRTGFMTTPLTLPAFLKAFEPYARQNLLAKDAKFFIPSENRAQTFESWKKESKRQ